MNGDQNPAAARKIPFLVRLRLLVGGWCNQVGWLIIGAGLIPCWIWGIRSDLLGPVYFRGETEIVDGRVLSSDETGYGVWHPDLPEHLPSLPIMKTSFKFTTPDGAAHEGVCYKANLYARAKQKAKIQYLKSDPSVSRLVELWDAINNQYAEVDTHLAIFSPVYGLVWLIPLAGLAVVIAGIIRSFKKACLLANGEVATASLRSKETTKAKVYGQTVYELTFSFVLEGGGSQDVKLKTHITQELEQAGKVEVLYCTNRPRCHARLDSLPGGARLDQAGNIIAACPAANVLSLALPIAAVAVNVIYGWMELKK